MSEYDELVKRLRSRTVGALPDHIKGFSSAVADTIEALVSNLDFERAAGHVQLQRASAAEAEVERLKGVLEDIKRNADCGGDAGLFRWQTLSEITKALEAKP